MNGVESDLDAVRHLKPMITALRLLSIMLVLQTGAASQPSANTRHIVLLMDERRELPGLAALNADFLSSLKSGSTNPLEIYTEEMDLSRFTSDAHQAQLRNYLREKYAGKKIDVVVAALEPSLDFLVNDGRDIFPGTPIVFCGIDKRELDTLVLPTYATGVLVKREFYPTLELALMLHPETKRIVIVAGSSEFDGLLINQARAEFQRFEDRLAFTYLTALPMPELLGRLSNLPPQTLVLYTTMFQDGAGTAFVPHEAAERIAAASNAPVYGFLDQFLGRGIVGGQLYGFGTQGEEAAKLTLRILSGTRPEEIRFVEPSAGTLMFDWRQLRRWNIREDKLPPGSIVQFKEFSFWELYRWRIVAVIAFVVMQSLLIVGLLVQQSRRTRAEASRLHSEESLQKLTGQLMHLQEVERRRIAGELHDGLGQDLAIIRNRATVGLQNAGKPEMVAEQLKEISETAASAINEVREIAHNLRPYELDRFGLIQAIESMIERVSSSFSLQVSSNLDNINGVFSTDSETLIYRIVQEGLNNVIKHAGGTEASVTLKHFGDEVAVIVADNGKGMNSADGLKVTGFGLAGIQERARMLGGSCTVDSRNGQGTTLTVRLMLSDKIRTIGRGKVG
jgi:signal transduction histidine kinase